MKTIFFLIRLPVFLIGLIFFLIIGIPLYIVGVSFGFIYWFFIVPSVWILILVPSKFIESAFAGSSDMLYSYKNKSRKNWEKELRDFYDSLKDFWKSYDELYSWLLHGSKK